MVIEIGPAETLAETSQQPKGRYWLAVAAVLALAVTVGYMFGVGHHTPTTSQPAAVQNAAILDGRHVTIGVDVPAGAYATNSTSAACVWDIEANGDRVDARAGEQGRITVTLMSGEDFVSSGCGDWVRQ